MDEIPEDLRFEAAKLWTRLLTIDNPVDAIAQLVLEERRRCARTLRGEATHAQKRAYDMGKAMEKDFPPDPTSKRRTGKRQASQGYRMKLKRQSHYFLKAANVIERNDGSRLNAALATPPAEG